MYRKPCLFQSHPNAWPFQKPVEKDSVPDYYDLIKYPMGQYCYMYMHTAIGTQVMSMHNVLRTQDSGKISAKFCQILL